MNRLKYCLIVVGVLWTFAAFSQSAQNILTSINLTYLSSKSTTMETEFILYKDYSATQVLERVKGNVASMGDAKYSSMGDIETINSKDYTLVVDHKKRDIFISRKFGDKAAALKSAPEISGFISKALTDCNRTACKDVNKEEGVVELYYSKGEYEKVYMTYDKKKMYITGISFFYRKVDAVNVKTPRIDIRYSKISLNAKLSPSKLSYENYLKEVGGKLVVKPKYKGYKLTDMYSKRK